MDIKKNEFNNIINFINLFKNDKSIEIEALVTKIIDKTAFDSVYKYFQSLQYVFFYYPSFLYAINNDFIFILCIQKYIVI